MPAVQRRHGIETEVARAIVLKVGVVLASRHHLGRRIKEIDCGNLFLRPHHLRVGLRG